MSAPSSAEPTLKSACPAGSLIGLHRGDTAVFKGITFARARRFGPPIDVEEWAGELDATTYRAQAPQVGGVLEKLLGGGSLPMDEDCLHLNVFAPRAGVGTTGARPVLVWIHGGAFVTGTGAMPWYDGSALVRRGDVVVVTINYRLGSLGFLADNNHGTADQVSALRWVRRNIAAFGGDPHNVTVFGESAGGSGVVALMATPGADDLFRRGWAMSPSILQLRTSERGAELARRFVDILENLGAVAEVGSRPPEHVNDLLRDVPVERLLAAQLEMRTNDAGMKDFAPTDGTELIPDRILDVAADDARPLVVGTNRDEMLLFTTFDPARSDWDDRDVERQFERRFGTEATEAIERYRSARPGSDASALVSAMQTDEVFRRPARQLASSRTDHPTWVYEFDYASTAFGGTLGSSHGLDIPFAFDNLERPGVELFTGPGSDRQPIADQFSSAIVEFARSGEAPWPRYDVTVRTTQRIGKRPDIVSDPEPQLRELWDR